MHAFAVFHFVCAASVFALAQSAVITLNLSEPVHVAVPGDFTNTLQDNPTYHAISFSDNETYAGIAAAFHEANVNGGIYGRNISATKFLTYGAHSSYTTEFNTNTEAMFKPYGPDKINFTAVAWSAFTVAARVMSLSKTVKKLPIVGVSSMDPDDYETGSPQALHLRSSPLSEAHHLLAFATQRLYCRRFLIFFMPAFGMPEVAAAVQAGIAKMNLPTPSMQMTVLVRNTTHHQAWKDQLLPTLDAMEEPPHGVFLFMDGETARHIVEVYSKSSRFKQGDMYFFMSSFGAVLNFTDSEGKSGVFKNLFYSTSYPFGDDQRYQIVKDYHDAMDAAVAANAIDVKTTSVHNAFALDGFVTGRAIVSTLRHMNPVDVTPEAFIDSFFSTKMFNLADLVFGPYSQKCVGHQTDITGKCWCNTGTKMQHIITVDPATGLAIGVRDNATLHEEAIAELNIGLNKCGIDDGFLIEPFVVTAAYDEPEAVKPADSRQPYFASPLYAELLSASGGAPVDMGKLGASIQEFTSHIHFQLWNNVNKEFAGEKAAQLLAGGRLFAVPQFVPSATVTTLREREKDRYKILAAMFLVTNAAAMAQHEHLSFAPLPPGLRSRDRDPDTVPFAQHDKYMVHVFPSLADFAHTAASYAASMGLASKVIVVADTAALLSLAQRSVETFGSPMLHGRVVSAYDYTAGLSATAPPASFTAASMASLTQQIEAAASTSSSGPSVVMVVTHEAVMVNAVLQVAKTTVGMRATFVLCASELVVAESIQFANDGSGRTSATNPATTLSSIPSGNVLFASGVPPGAALSHNTMEAYGEAVGRAVFAAFEVPSDRTGLGMAKAVMQLGTLSHKSVTMEPLSVVDCGLTAPVYPHPGGTCQCTKGLNQMQLYNVTAASIAAGQLAMNFDRATHQLKYAQCGISYTPLPTNPVLTTLEISLIAAGGFVLLFTAVFLVLFCIFRPKGRDVSNAPKESTKPFAVVFTDIQASTAMWALAPEHMGRGIDVHHRTLRDLIATYKGYEVKTIGDSFMVAFIDASAAARFALATQRALYDAPWNTFVFDQTYDDILNEKFPELDKTIRAGGNEKLWQGIRVRVGVHYGHGTVVFDETTQAYDYYGTVVNTAARVEGVSHGGQVVLTQAAYDALTPGAIELDGEVVVKNLGPQPLRGLPEDITLVQVLPEQFAMREFPPLRLDVEIVLENEEGSSSSGGGTTSDKSGGKLTAKGSTANMNGPLNPTTVGGSEVPSSQRSSNAPTTVQGVAKRLLAKGGNKAPLEVLLLVDRAMATLMAPDTQSNRVSAMKRWADKWRLPKLHRRDAKAFKRVPTEDVGRIRLALRVVESMAAAGHIAADLGGGGVGGGGGMANDLIVTSVFGGSVGRDSQGVRRPSGTTRSSRQMSTTDAAVLAAMAAGSATSRDGFTIPGRTGSPIDPNKLSPRRNSGSPTKLKVTSPTGVTQDGTAQQPASGSSDTDGSQRHRSVTYLAAGGSTTGIGVGFTMPPRQGSRSSSGGGHGGDSFTELEQYAKDLDAAKK